MLLGGNEGRVLSNFSAAIAILEQKAGCITKLSPVFSTAAWGPVKQADFLNLALELRTAIPPGMLMNILLETERRFGRKRDIKYGPRTLDIDMIFYGSRIVNLEGLKIPHPKMQERRFVLEPCAAIIPDFRHPILHKTISELLKQCKDPLEVKLLP